MINQRDVTKAQRLVQMCKNSVTAVAEALSVLDRLLDDIDARTGTRDPSVRKNGNASARGAAGPKIVKKAAKRSTGKKRIAKDPLARSRSRH